MFEFIEKLKSKIITRIEAPEERKPALWAHMVKKGCPDCKTHPMAYLEGPSGGMSTNIECSECGSKFNITPAIGLAERI